MSLCSQNYSDDHGYIMLRNLKGHLKTLDDYANEPDMTIKYHAK